MKNELLKVDVTYPLTSDCERIAKDVIKLKLAVCVQIFPNHSKHLFMEWQHSK